MKRVLLSSFACDPTKGSEPGCGWNWAVGLAEKGFEVHCITRDISKVGISTRQIPRNLKFSYIRLPFGMEKLYSASQSAMYLYYLLWQWKAYKLAVALHKINKFDIAHHVTWGNLQLGSFMYKLDIPLVFGPAGGGQMAPTAFKEYFGDAWSSEETRNRVSRLLLKFNPACRDMLQRASVVLASNEDTLRVAELNGASNTSLAPDVGVPDWFFPKENVIKVSQKDSLKLLWVGRFMPRKGLLLLLDVMKQLKDYPGITLTVVGDGVMKDVFLDKLKRYALEDTVHWHGWVPFKEVRDYYAGHDVFLFTSLRESGGMQLVEAMAFGMPVVTLDLHGPGLIVGPDRGFRCACSTPDIAIENLRVAILELYNNPALVGQLSAGSFRFAANQAWSNKIDDIVDRFYC
jgi:glycosyltransferase involved in cell wall biosynthesis